MNKKEDRVKGLKKLMELSEAELLNIVKTLALNPNDIKLETDAIIYEMSTLIEPLDKSIKEYQTKRALSLPLETSEDMSGFISLRNEIFDQFPNY